MKRLALTFVLALCGLTVYSSDLLAQGHGGSSHGRSASRPSNSGPRKATAPSNNHKIGATGYSPGRTNPGGRGGDQKINSSRMPAHQHMHQYHGRQHPSDPKGPLHNAGRMHHG